MYFSGFLQYIMSRKTYIKLSATDPMDISEHFDSSLSPVGWEAEPSEPGQPAASDRVLVGLELLAEGKVCVGAYLGQPGDPREEVRRLLKKSLDSLCPYPG